MLIRQQAEGDERELLPAVRLTRGSMMRWHPDGRSLLAGGTKDNKTGLYRIDAGTGEASLVHEGLFMEWSPDGKWGFSQGGENRRSIVRREPATGEEKIIHTGDGSARLFRISPDGRRLVFFQGVADPKNAKPYLAVVSTGGGPADRIFTRDEADGNLSPFTMGTAWTPDGRRILFVRQKDQRATLWMVPAAGGEARKTELDLQGRMGELNVHPDGKRIAYTILDFKHEYWVMENFLP